MSSKESKRSARDQLAEQRKAQAAADKRKQTITNTVIVVVVVAVVIGIFVAVQASRTSGPDTAAFPATVTEQGAGVVVGSADAPVTLDLWEDFQCPICKDFEASVGEDMAALVDDGTLKVVIHPVSFLDAQLNNLASIQAAAALGCAADAGKPLEFHGTVFANQPATEGDGWTIDQLVQWGKDSGIDDADFEPCVTDQVYAPWGEQVLASMTDAGVTGTPTLFIDGEKVSDEDRAAMTLDSKKFVQAIEDAAQS